MGICVWGRAMRTSITDAFGSEGRNFRQTSTQTGLQSPVLSPDGCRQNSRERDPGHEGHADRSGGGVCLLRLGNVGGAADHQGSRAECARRQVARAEEKPAPRTDSHHVPSEPSERTCACDRSRSSHQSIARHCKTRLDRHPGQWNCDVGRLEPWLPQQPVPEENARMVGSGAGRAAEQQGDDERGRRECDSEGTRNRLARLALLRTEGGRSHAVSGHASRRQSTCRRQRREQRLQSMDRRDGDPTSARACREARLSAGAPKDFAELRSTVPHPLRPPPAATWAASRASTSSRCGAPGSEAALRRASPRGRWAGECTRTRSRSSRARR